MIAFMSSCFSIEIDACQMIFFSCMIFSCMNFYRWIPFPRSLMYRSSIMEDLFTRVKGDNKDNYRSLFTTHYQQQLIFTRLRTHKRHLIDPPWGQPDVRLSPLAPSSGPFSASGMDGGVVSVTGFFLVPQLQGQGSMGVMLISLIVKEVFAYPLKTSPLWYVWEFNVWFFISRKYSRRKISTFSDP